MAKPELGEKQICPSCGAKFYDLTRRPAHCPKCQTEFDPEEVVKTRRSRVRPHIDDTDDEVAEKPAAAAAEDDDGYGEEADETPEIDAVDANVIADDDEEDDTKEPVAGKKKPGADDDLGVDFASDDEEADADDDDVPFLEDDDDFDEDEIEGLPGEDEDRD